MANSKSKDLRPIIPAFQGYISCVAPELWSFPRDLSLFPPRVGSRERNGDWIEYVSCRPSDALLSSPLLERIHSAIHLFLLFFRKEISHFHPYMNMSLHSLPLSFSRPTLSISDSKLWRPLPQVPPHLRIGGSDPRFRRRAWI